jgi:hypothetical protein
MAKQDFKDFAIKLSQKEDEIRQKLRFTKEHKFERESEWLNAKMEIIRSIRFEAEFIADGHRAAHEANFRDI